MSEVAESEVVEGTATEIVPRPVSPPTNLFRTEDPVEVIEKATAVANALKGVLSGQRMIVQIQRKDHVTVEGWTTLGSMLGVTAIVTHTEPIERGFKARVEARASDGRVVGAAEAICSKDEPRWKSADDYALLSMAQTRATSKALKGPLGFVVKLAGYETTPAEEMTFVQPPAPEPQSNGATKALPAARIAELKKAREAADVDDRGLKMLLIDVGVRDTGKNGKPVPLRVMRSLTVEQADRLEQRLSDIADQRLAES